MSDGTKIEWADASWNPIRGCSRASPGCEHCCAERFAARGLPGYAGLTRGGRWTGEVRLDEHTLEQPLRWRRPRRVVVCSMSDLFYERVPDEWIDRVWAMMMRAHHHVYCVLTKRAARMRTWSARLPPAAARHVWLGVTVEDQMRARIRIPDLIATPAAVHWVSAEPLLGPLDLSSYSPGLDWIVVGGETGPRARPCREAWLRGVVWPAKVARVACYLTQMGGYPDRRADPSGWMGYLRVREYPGARV